MPPELLVGARGPRAPPLPQLPPPRPDPMDVDHRQRRPFGGGAGGGGSAMDTGGTTAAAQPPAAPAAPPPPYDAAAVDAWACGVLLYLLVAGVYPFEDPACHSLSRTIQNILRGARRPLPPGVSRECAARIDGLLRREPRERLRLRPSRARLFSARGGRQRSRG